MSRSAIVLHPEQRDELFETIPFVSRMPARDLLVFRLSFFAALRGCEMAHLKIDDMLGPRGDILDEIRIAPNMTKGSRGRSLPMHRMINGALIDFLDTYPDARWVAISPRGGRQMRPATLIRAMDRLYTLAGFSGCGSHTGRATCITEMARHANLLGCSLRDVQKFAGHRRLETTASYLGSTDRLTDLVSSLGNRNDHERRLRIGTKTEPRHQGKPRRVRSERDRPRSVQSGIVGRSYSHGDGRRDEERLERKRDTRRARRHRPARRDG
jgi:integrase